ncbi:MAG: hypothetical protein MUC36_16895 [Planctomycetes bacterium]|nr:hypothetical protein [Planctomycetota bacterium]
MNRSWPWLLVSLALPLPLPAQGLQKAHEASTAMHAAWLREVLDLDTAGAVREYRHIAGDARPSNLERWLAMARLGELHRIGVDTGPRIPIAEAPATVRSALQATETTLPIDELLQRLQAEPPEIMRRVGTEAGKMPPLRPATPLVQDWVRSQIGPSLDENLARRMQNMSRQPDQRSELSLANDILNLELQGRAALASNRRTLFFANWQPVVAGGDPAAALAKARAELESWSKEPDISSLHQRRINDLRQAIDQRAAIDPAAMLALIGRVPVYAERLLGAGNRQDRGSSPDRGNK